MDNASKIAHLSEDMYRPMFGVNKQTFDKMLDVLERKHSEIRKKGGPKPKRSVLDMLIIFFAYVRDGRTMQNIAFDYGCKKDRISRMTAWVTKTLAEDGTFSLPSKRELVKEDPSVVIAIVDVTEQETERPKKTKK